MKLVLFPGFVLFTAAACFGQNSVSISQTGGAGNTASIIQSGDGNSVSINQHGGAITDGSKPGNRVSLRVPKGTETTINQQNAGPNTVEISQEGQATAVINQSSSMGENSIHTLSNAPLNQPKTRSSKRRKRQYNQPLF